MTRLEMERREVMLDHLIKKLKISEHTKKIDNLVDFLHWLEDRDDIVFKDGKIFLNINEEFEVKDKDGQVVELDFWVNSMELTCLDVAVMYLSEKGDK